MILGVGTDLCEVGRVAGALERTGDRFAGRLFTEAERRAAESDADRARGYALRFAAKEAAFKALAGGWPDDMSFGDVELAAVTPPLTQLRLSGRAGDRARARGVARLLAAVSVEGGLAVAVVLAEGP